MSDIELFRLLKRMGIARGHLGVLALLPLVEVAVASGEMGPSARVRIARIAADAKLPAAGEMLVESWLAYTPSPHYFHLGRTALSRFAARPDPELPADRWSRFEKHMHKVTTADSGWLPFRTLPPETSLAIDRVMRALKSPSPSFAQPPEPPADFVRRSPAIPLAEAPIERDPNPARLVPEFARHRSHPITVERLVLGSSERALHRLGDGDLLKRHAVIERREGRWYASALEGPLWVNGEQVTRRALLGGEILRLTPATALWFRCCAPNNASDSAPRR